MSQKFPMISLGICLIAVFVLCGLGVWQIERLQWKNNLQNELDKAFSKEQADAFTAEQFETIQKGQVIRGTIDGVLDLSKAVFVHGRIQDGKAVMSVVAPFAISKSHIVVPVEVGCSEHPDTKIVILPDEEVFITGILREPKWSFATPANIPDQGEWWRMDSRELGAYWNIPNLETAVITVENTKDFSPSLSACLIEKKLRNDHASYAFFWFTMAVALSVIWGIRFLKPYLQSA